MLRIPFARTPPHQNEAIEAMMTWRIQMRQVKANGDDRVAQSTDPPSMAEVSDGDVEAAEAAAIAAEARAAEARATASEVKARANSHPSSDEAASTTSPDLAGKSSQGADDARRSSATMDEDARRDASSRRARKRSVAWLGWTAVVLLTCMFAAGLSIFFYVRHHEHSTSEVHDVAIVQAARQGVVHILSINAATADADVQRVLADATGAWRDDFKQRSVPFIEVVTKGQVVTVGDVNDAGIERVNDDGSVLVMVSATSKVTNAAGAEEEARTWRLRVTISEDNGLKISNLEFVP